MKLNSNDKKAKEIKSKNAGFTIMHQLSEILVQRSLITVSKLYENVSQCVRRFQTRVRRCKIGCNRILCKVGLPYFHCAKGEQVL